MKNRQGVAALCVIILTMQPLLSACGQKAVPSVRPGQTGTSTAGSAEKKAEFQKQLEQFNADHIAEGGKMPEGTIIDYEEPLPEKDVGFTEKELESLTDYKKAAQPSDSALISPAQAKVDTELFFRVLKYCYGPYRYFGGDAKFGKAKVAVLSEIPVKNISTRCLEDILIQNLGFVQDVHFTIGDRHFADFSVYLHSEAAEYAKDASGYYKTENGKKYYVALVDGKDPAEFMKLSISPGGKLVYYVGGLYGLKQVNEQKKLPSVTVSYRSGGTSDTLQFPQWVSPDDKPGEGFRKSELGGVPVVSIRRFMDNDAKDTACEDFAASGSALKGKKVMILDLRGNGGGNDEYAINWIKNFTSKWSGKSAIAWNQITLQSRAGEYIFSKFMLSLPKVTENVKLEAKSAMEAYRNGKNQWNLNQFLFHSQTDNTSLICVLMDKNNASSGEDVISFLSNLKNVVLVGTNTAGCMIGNVAVSFVLPNSRLNVACANWLESFNSDVFTEGVGLKPDIWDASGKTDRLLAMLRYYHLTDAAK